MMKPFNSGQKSSGGGLKLSSLLLNIAHPVGSIIQTTKTQAQFDPNTMLGGTWRLLRGVFLYGAEADSAITSNVLDGGEKAHVLSVAEMPSHVHSYAQWGYNLGQSLGTPGTPTYWMGSRVVNTGAAGSNGAHNNMPPYKNVNIWERTA